MNEVKKPTLCWNCQNATGNCSWSDYNERSPVKGWIAQEVKLKDPLGTSYIVLQCPEFIPDVRRK